MKKVIVKEIQVACFRCHGSKVLVFPDGQSVQCPKCLGRGTLPAYGKEEVDDEAEEIRDDPEDIRRFFGKLS